MKKKVLLFLVLATLVAGGAFAQKVGDTVDFYGKNYTVKEAKDGSVLLQLTPTLDGTWKNENGGETITFNGNTAVYKQISSSPLTQDAVKKGFIKVGGQAYRNLKKTGALTWTGQNVGFQSYTDTPNICEGVTWVNTTLTLSADGKTFQTTNRTIYTRQ
jgi:hypothetical protein